MSLPLTNFEIQKYYQNKFKFKDVYSGNDLFKTEDRINVIYLDEYQSIGTHWIVFYVNGDNVTCFDSTLELNAFQKKLNNS